MGTKHFGAGILLLGTSFGSAHAADPVVRFLQLYGSEFKAPAEVAVLGKGTALVAQRTDGKVIFFDKGNKTTALDLPVANGKGQGLLDISLSSIFKQTHHVELTFTGAAKDGGRSTGPQQQVYYWSPTAKKLTPVNNNNINIGGASLILNSGSLSSSPTITINQPPISIGGGSAAGITLIDFASVGVLGAGTNDLITVNGDISLNSDALFRINNLNPGTNSIVDPAILNPPPLLTSPSDQTASAFRGSFTLVDPVSDPSLPGYHLIGVTTTTPPTAGQLTVANTPEPAAGAILLAAAGVLMKRRRLSK